MLQQVAILTVTFLVLLGVLLFLRVFFVPTIGELVTSNRSATESLTGPVLDQSVINLLYFHAALLQAVMTGLVTGYIRRTSLWAGLKYVVVYTVLTAGVWALVT
jgi:flagellar protein FlaJ